MKKILNLILKLAQTLWSLIDIIFLQMLPFLVLFYVSWGYVGAFFKADPTSEQYKLLFSAILFAATLSSISFSASNNAEELKEKLKYRLAAKKFLYAVIQLILATVLSYAYLKLGKESLLHRLILSLKGIIVLVGSVLFYTGVLKAVHGFEDLHDLLTSKTATKLEPK